MDEDVLRSLWDALHWAQRGNDLRQNDIYRDAEYQAHIRLIEEAVAKHPQLGALEGKFVQSGSASARVSNHLVGAALLRRAYECDSADIAVRDAIEFIQSPQLNVLTVLTLAGIQTDHSIALSESIKLSPPSALPTTDNFHRLFPHAATKGEQLVFFPSRVFPTAALTRSWSMLSPIVDATIENLTGPLDQNEEDLDLDQAMCCIILCTTEGVQRMHRYYDNLHPGHLWPSSGWSEHPAIATYREPATLSGANLAELFALTKKFSDWPEFYRLVKRLNSARCKPDLVDAHIDLGIVAECALTKGDKQESEISQRLRTRAAWLLGRDAHDRRQVANSMNDLYGRRSSAAHRGVVSQSKRTHFEKDDQLCRNILIEILRRGRFPQSADWNAIVYG